MICNFTFGGSAVNRSSFQPRRPLNLHPQSVVHCHVTAAPHGPAPPNRSSPRMDRDHYIYFIHNSVFKKIFVCIYYLQCITFSWLILPKCFVDTLVPKRLQPQTEIAPA